MGLLELQNIVLGLAGFKWGWIQEGHGSTSILGVSHGCGSRVEVGDLSERIL